MGTGSGKLQVFLVTPPSNAGHLWDTLGPGEVGQTGHNPSTTVAGGIGRVADFRLNEQMCILATVVV